MIKGKQDMLEALKNAHTELAIAIDGAGGIGPHGSFDVFNQELGEIASVMGRVYCFVMQVDDEYFSGEDK